VKGPAAAAGKKEETLAGRRLSLIEEEEEQLEQGLLSCIKKKIVDKKHSFVICLPVFRIIACTAVFRSRICRIRKFLGHLDPYLLVRGTDPD
jgi:hypothetical protein